MAAEHRELESQQGFWSKVGGGIKWALSAAKEKINSGYEKTKRFLRFSPVEAVTNVADILNSGLAFATSVQILTLVIDSVHKNDQLDSRAEGIMWSYYVPATVAMTLLFIKSLVTGSQNRAAMAASRALDLWHRLINTTLVWQFFTQSSLVTEGDIFESVNQPQLQAAPALIATVLVTLCLSAPALLKTEAEEDVSEEYIRAIVDEFMSTHRAEVVDVEADNSGELVEALIEALRLEGDSEDTIDDDALRTSASALVEAVQGHGDVDGAAQALVALFPQAPDAQDNMLERLCKKFSDSKFGKTYWVGKAGVDGFSVVLAGLQATIQAAGSKRTMAAKASEYSTAAVAAILSAWLEFRSDRDVNRHSNTTADFLLNAGSAGIAMYNLITQVVKPNVGKLKRMTSVPGFTAFNILVAGVAVFAAVAEAHHSRNEASRRNGYEEIPSAFSASDDSQTTVRRGSYGTLNETMRAIPPGGSRDLPEVLAAADPTGSHAANAVPNSALDSASSDAEVDVYATAPEPPTPPQQQPPPAPLQQQDDGNNNTNTSSAGEASAAELLFSTTGTLYATAEGEDPHGGNGPLAAQQGSINAADRDVGLDTRSSAGAGL